MVQIWNRDKNNILIFLPENWYRSDVFNVKEMSPDFAVNIKPI